MHEIDAVTVFADDLYDTLLIDTGAVGLVVEPRGAAPVGPDNLVARALASLNVAARVELHKAIPSEAGLGGGSADAAAVLRSLGGEVGPDALRRIATSLGADVAVCLQTHPTRMTGVGDVLEALSPTQPLHLVIATPTFGCSTPAVYKAWDRLHGPTSDRAIAAPTGWAGCATEFRNDLEPAAILVEPRLVAFREALALITEGEPMLCGSGSSYCVWFETRAAADAAASEAARVLDVRVACAVTSR